MSNRSLGILVGAAAVLCAAAYFTSGSRSSPSSRLAGEKLAVEFDLAKVASVDIGGKVRLVAGTNGWAVSTYQDYPADIVKIRENLLRLKDAKVGQVVRGRELREKTEVVLRDDAGAELAKVTLGDRHEKWGRGRYALKGDTTVLVGDALDGFGPDPKDWLETKIVDDPYVSFRELADPAFTEEELGFATGVVAKVTIAGDTNRVATIGNVVKGGSDRYMKLDGKKWVFVVPSYSVDKLLPKPPPEEKKEEAREEAAESAEKEAAPDRAEEPAKVETPAAAPGKSAAEP